MFKFRRLLCIVLVCALVGVAYGAARKINNFVPQGSERATADGMAILNYVSGANKTITQIVINGFTPNTSYDAKFVSPSLGTSAGFDVIVTDENGDGHAHLVDLGLDTSDTDIYLYVNLFEAGEELRAIGAQ